MDLWHRQNGWAGVGYHFFIRKDGTLELGRDLEKTPAAQAPYNSGTIAICLHGLAKTKFTAAQFATLLNLCHQINDAYNGALTFHGHCEVAAKACPVFAYRNVLGISSAGVLPRKKDAASAAEITLPKIEGIEQLELPDTGTLPKGIVKSGDRGGAVVALQEKLTALNYHVGQIDGIFGSRTRGALMAFQADNYLIADGIYGPLSREAMMSASARPVADTRAVASLVSLAGSGSTIAKASLNNQMAGLALSAGGLVTVLNEVTGILPQLTSSMGAVGDALAGLGQWQGVLLAGLGIYVAIRAVAAGKAHVEDYRSGKTA